MQQPAPQSAGGLPSPEAPAQSVHSMEGTAGPLRMPSGGSPEQQGGSGEGLSPGDPHDPARLRVRKVGRQPRTTVPCQVPGCGEELIHIKGYYKR